MCLFILTKVQTINYLIFSEEPTTSEQADLTDKKILFLAKILESEKKKHTHYNVLLRDEYAELMAQVEAGSKSGTKSQIQRRVNRFAVLNIEGEKRLVTKTEGNPKYFLPAERLFDEIHRTHLLVKHGGRDRMLTETSAIYANVTKEMVNTYLLMCEVCLQKKGKKRKETEVMPTSFPTIHQFPSI